MRGREGGGSEMAKGECVQEGMGKINKAGIRVKKRTIKGRNRENGRE